MWSGRGQVNAVYVLALVALFCYMQHEDVEPSLFNSLNCQCSSSFCVAGCIAIGFVAGESEPTVVSRPSVPQERPHARRMLPTSGRVSNHLRPLRGVVAFAPAFGELGGQMGVNPLPVHSSGADSIRYFFPYEGVMFSSSPGCVTLETSFPR